VTKPTARLVFDVRGPMLEAVRACEAEVFNKWYGNTREQLEQEYGPFDSSSAFLALVNERSEVMGTCRVIIPGAPGLKTMRDLSAPPWGLDPVRSAGAVGMDLSTTWDVATLGVRPGLVGNGRMAAAALYHGLIQATRANDVSCLVSVLDERVRSLLRSVGVVTHPLPGATTQPYLGSAASTPVYGKMPASLDTWRRIAPEAYRLIAMGTGLDGIDVPSLEQFRLRPRRVPLIDLTEPSTVAASAHLDANVV